MTPREILDAYRTFAVVGLSPKPDRPSHDVASFLKSHGYRIVPVNPGHRRILDETCYPDLASIPFPIEVVDIFRRSDRVGPVVDEAIAIGAKVVWMQIGVIDEPSAAKARAAGLEVVMDRCPKIEFYRR
jgi:predicted CoA-binding protein